MAWLISYPADVVKSRLQAQEGFAMIFSPYCSVTNSSLNINPNRKSVSTVHFYISPAWTVSIKGSNMKAGSFVGRDLVQH